jgi:hypothetical protein
MARKETGNKVCWWHKAGQCLDLVLTFTPKKEKKVSSY